MRSGVIVTYLIVSAACGSYKFCWYLIVQRYRCLGIKYTTSSATLSCALLLDEVNEVIFKNLADDQLNGEVILLWPDSLDKTV
jgi:hypothetical protein